MGARELFSDEQLQAIRRSVAEAETRSSGEIVTVIAERSDDYEQVQWKGAALGGVGAAVAAAVWVAAVEGWGAAAPWILMPPLLGAGAGYLLTRLVAPLRRGLAGGELLALRVSRRAAQAFLDEEVFATRERTGILLFLSLFERRVEVLADAGIHAGVPDGTWERLAAELAAGVRAGRAPEALVEAVESCGALLARHGPERPADDTDELDDRVRFPDG